MLETHWDSPANSLAVGLSRIQVLIDGVCKQNLTDFRKPILRACGMCVLKCVCTCVRACARAHYLSRRPKNGTAPVLTCSQRLGQGKQLWSLHPKAECVNKVQAWQAQEQKKTYRKQLGARHVPCQTAARTVLGTIKTLHGFGNKSPRCTSKKVTPISTEGANTVLRALSRISSILREKIPPQFRDLKSDHF